MRKNSHPRPAPALFRIMIEAVAEILRERAPPVQVYILDKNSYLGQTLNRYTSDLPPSFPYEVVMLLRNRNVVTKW